jgi:hypothetical protein
MKMGQEIVLLEERPDGRRAYLCREGKRFHYRCLRRAAGGWCQRKTLGPCEQHEKGDRPASEHGSISYHVLGSEIEMPAGYSLVGYIPGHPNTYFVRLPSGIIRAACLRRRSLSGRVRSAEQGRSAHPFCLRHPIKVDGRYRGGCRQHKGGTPYRAIAFRNAMDPKFLTLVNRAAKSHPAIQQIQERLDTITYAWHVLLEAIVTRDNALEEDPDLPRSTGIEAIIGAAGNVRDATKIESREQAATFRVTGRDWAQQAYSLRLAQVLAEASEPAGWAATDRIGHRMKKAMIKRGLIRDNRELPTLSSRRSADNGRSSDMELEVIEGFRARNAHELDLLTALHQTGRAKEYVALVDMMGERLLSLHPLVTTLDDMIVVETAARSPFIVINKLVRARNKVREAQALIDSTLNISLTERQAREIGESVVNAVMDAIEDERPEVQQTILMRFMELKDEVEMPSRADGAVEIVVEALKEARKP